MGITTSVGVGAGGGVGIGVVKPGDVIRWAMEGGENATELEPMAMIPIIGRINSSESTKMRLANNLKLDLNFDIDADVD